MDTDFPALVNPGTMSCDIDVEGTRAYRHRIHEAIRVQQQQHPFGDLQIPPDPGVASSNGPLSWRQLVRRLLRTPWQPSSA